MKNFITFARYIYAVINERRRRRQRRRRKTFRPRQLLALNDFSVAAVLIVGSSRSKRFTQSVPLHENDDSLFKIMKQRLHKIKRSEGRKRKT